MHTEGEVNLAEDQAFWGPIISSYSRAQALEDGVLVAVPQTMAEEAGFRLPVTLTANAWAACVALPPEGDRHGQDEDGRLWDVLWLAGFTARQRRHRDQSRANFSVSVYDVEREQAIVTELVVVAGPGDEGEPVITIMRPNED